MIPSPFLIILIRCPSFLENQVFTVDKSDEIARSNIRSTSSFTSSRFSSLFLHDHSDSLPVLLWTYHIYFTFPNLLLATTLFLTLPLHIFLHFLEYHHSNSIPSFCYCTSFYPFPNSFALLPLYLVSCTDSTLIPLLLIGSTTSLPRTVKVPLFSIAILTATEGTFSGCDRSCRGNPRRYTEFGWDLL